MRAICFREVQSVVVDEVADAKIENDRDVVVQVELAGLCGSDLHPYFGREVGLDVGTVMGHEFVGKVIDKGDRVTSVDIGDRICAPFTSSCGECYYCKHGLSARCSEGQLFGWRQDGAGLHGGQAELVRVPLADGTVVKVPDWVSASDALLLGDNLSTAFYGASLSIDEQQGADCVVVIGCGTVGLLSIGFAFQRQARKVVAIDLNASRARQAAQRGADSFTDADEAASFVRAHTNGRGADAVLEFVGLPQAQRLAYDLIRPGGKMSVIGCHTAPHFAFSPAEAYDKNLVLGTGRCPARSLMDAVADQMKHQPLDLSWCLTHRFSIDQGVEAYDVFANRKDGCVKAAIEFDLID
ncbi:alcohol dehydrogenase catalytic domain-containing protein [Stieleria sp. JC731]|uniref:alcohol dehydrogenase catalytic domain-containing protein n=1 Tax=Pirellulaceae TaxID=2691357 RepID=UPI001E3304CE|nr:alcohol dehydrogenase catalytic domain-containing protein [Stieleria sp. JC731]MCC9603008.1 alcohol dehydrogenase catalytic domain-containing protein [Stieleria sp. JC731]